MEQGSFVAKTIDTITPKFVREWVGPKTESQKEAAATWANIYAAIVIISILLIIWNWVFRGNFTVEPFAALVSSQSNVTEPQSTDLTANLGFNSIRDEKFTVSGAPMDIGPACGDVSADMNYAMNIIQQKNPSALNSPFWPDYYKLLINYVQLKRAANADSTLSPDASNAFDLLREYEMQTGFNPLQANWNLNETPGQVVASSADIVASVVPAAPAVQATSPFATSSARSLVGGGGVSKFSNRARFDGSSRANVGGFAGKRSRFADRKKTRFADVGSADASGTHPAEIVATASQVGMIPPLYIGQGDGGWGTQSQYQSSNPMSSYPTQSMSNGSAFKDVSWYSDNDFHRMLLNNS